MTVIAVVLLLIMLYIKLTFASASLKLLAGLRWDLNVAAKEETDSFDESLKRHTAVTTHLFFPPFTSFMLMCFHLSDMLPGKVCPFVAFDLLVPSLIGLGLWKTATKDGCKVNITRTPWKQHGYKTDKIETNWIKMTRQWGTFTTKHWPERSLSSHHSLQVQLASSLRVTWHLVNGTNILDQWLLNFWHVIKYLALQYHHHGQHQNISVVFIKMKQTFNS